MGGSCGNILILKLLSDIYSNFAKLAESCNLHSVYPNVFFNCILEGGCSIFAFVYYPILILSTIYNIVFLIYCG